MSDWFEFTEHDIEILDSAVAAVGSMFEHQTAAVVAVLEQVLEDVPAPLHQIAIEEAVTSWLDHVQVEVEFRRLANAFD